MKDAFDLSVSGLVAQRQRMNVIAGNIANVNTTRDANGNASPFQRRLVTFAPETSETGSRHEAAGVTYEVQTDQETPFRKVYDPGHQDADEDGNVLAQTAAIGDLAEDKTVRIETLPEVLEVPDGVVAVVARHIGEGYSVNSIDATCATLAPMSS